MSIAKGVREVAHPCSVAKTRISGGDTFNSLIQHDVESGSRIKFGMTSNTLVIKL